MAWWALNMNDFIWWSHSTVHGNMGCYVSKGGIQTEYKLNGILAKNKYTPTKLLNFVNIYSVAPAQNGHSFRN